MSVLRERRMVRHIAIEAKATEPAVCQIEMDLIAQPPLRADAEAIADDQHSSARDRSKGAPPCCRTAPAPASAHQEPIDRAQQMIGWYVPIERKLMEQHSLFDFPMSHHDSQSCFSQRLNQRTSCVATPTFSTESDPFGHRASSSWRRVFRWAAGRKTARRLQ
jgi:hypothetical protein